MRRRFDDHFVEAAGQLPAEVRQAEVVDDDQVWSEQAPDVFGRIV